MFQKSTLDANLRVDLFFYVTMTKGILKTIFYKICVRLEAFLEDKKARILMYHSFKKDDIFFNVKPESFLEQIDYLQEKSFIFITVSELFTKIKNKENISKHIALTFDDGHKDFLDFVYPILKERNIKSTLFWPTKMPDNILKTSTGMECEILSIEDVKNIFSSGLVELGSHGVTHREFTKISDIDLEDEIEVSREDIKNITSFYPESVAYPRGKFSQKVIEVARSSGFKYGLTVKEGGVDKNTDLFRIPRISIDSSVDMLKFRAKLSSFYAIVSSWRG